MIIADILLDLIYAQPPEVRAESRFYVTPLAVQKLRAAVDTRGVKVWMEWERSARLMGYTVLICNVAECPGPGIAFEPGPIPHKWIALE